MEVKDFEKDVQDIFDQCQKLLISKGREYQSTNKEQSNVFENFERNGRNLDLPPETILWIYFSKHIDSLATLIKDIQNDKSFEEINQNLSEPISGRVVDAINYLLIFNSMIKERERDVSNKPSWWQCIDVKARNDN